MANEHFTPAAALPEQTAQECQLSPFEVAYFQVLGNFDGAEYAISRELSTLALAEEALTIALERGWGHAHIVRAGWDFDEGDPVREEFLAHVNSDLHLFARPMIRVQWRGVQMIHARWKWRLQ